MSGSESGQQSPAVVAAAMAAERAAEAAIAGAASTGDATEARSALWLRAAEAECAAATALPPGHPALAALREAAAAAAADVDKFGEAARLLRCGGQRGHCHSRSRSAPARRHGASHGRRLLAIIECLMSGNQ